MKKQFKKASGITLIALVITIVVLIILATVSINMILDDNGIIGAAELAKDKYQNAAKEEQEGLGYLYEELTESLNPNVDMVKSEDNQYVPVPKGYVASTDPKERKVSEGFVIKKGTNGAATDVNEFVWVPVSEASFNNMFITSTTEPIYLSGQSGETGVKTDYYSNLRIRTGNSFTKRKPGESSGVREPDLVVDYDNDSYAVQAGYTNLATMAQGFVDDYKNMRASIQKYKGFYIGRYELTGSIDNPTVQEGAVLTAASGKAGNWYGLYKACRNVAKAGEKVTSTMIWGCQWDETMNWLRNTKFKNNTASVDSDSSSWGNYSTKQDTGNNESWSANNIYDLAGNYNEWTQEANGTSGRILRGGYYHLAGYNVPVTNRENNFSNANNYDNCTRVTLYINP